MGYAAARGGLAAIVAAEDLVDRERTLGPSPWLDAAQLNDRLRLLVDRVMAEGGLWDPDLAAAAIRQAEGDVIEAAHLLRSHRSTLPRFAYSQTVSLDDMTVLRRIVPAFRDPPGQQLLGRTTDYAGRLLDLTDETVARERAEKASADETLIGVSDDEASDTDDDDAATSTAHAAPTPADRHPGRLSALLRQADLTVDRSLADDADPVDITRVPVRPPAARSARLAVMARAETGALVNLWYRNVLGPDGYVHEVTLGEVRHGRLDVSVAHPHTGGAVRVGTVRATEVEAIEDLDGIDEDRHRFDIGFGMCLGHNEKKAIAMANLDIACHRDAGRSPLEQSILMTTDGLDASGFLEHLKLPHYVTFRSMIERKMAMRSTADRDGGGRPVEHAPLNGSEGDCA